MTIKLKLTVNGQEYGGWKSARVTRGIEAIAGGFELEATDRWAERSEPWPIGEGDVCKLAIDKTTLITGYVGKRHLSYDAESHSFSVSGRDKTGDLVDCSANLGKWEFKGIDVLTLAKRVCDPFGISVSIQPGLTLAKVAKLSIDPGDTGFEVIERVCRIAGLLPISDGSGGLLLTRAAGDGDARANTELIEGGNILSASADYDSTGRFHRYVVLGQHQGTDELSGAKAASIKGEATDANVTRTARELIIRPEGNVTPAQAKTRAQWEAIVRAARGDAVTITVQGWTMGNGELWPVNALVKVKSPRIGVNGYMLITQATYSLDDSAGTTTQLSLKRQGAFTPEPIVTTVKTRAWKALAGGV